MQENAGFLQDIIIIRPCVHWTRIIVSLDPNVISGVGLGSKESQFPRVDDSRLCVATC